MIHTVGPLMLEASCLLLLLLLLLASLTLQQTPWESTESALEAPADLMNCEMRQPSALQTSASVGRSRNLD